MEGAKALGKQRVQQQQEQGATGPLVGRKARPMWQTDLSLSPVSLNPFLCIKTGSHFWDSVLLSHLVLTFTCHPLRFLEEAMALSSCSNGSLEPLDSDGLVAHNDQVKYLFSFLSNVKVG